MIKCAVFDLDGTILNTLGDLHAAVNYAMRTLGKPEHTREQVRRMIGDGVAKLIERALPEDCVNLSAQALGIFKSYYESHICVHTRPYGGIKEMLESLRSKGVKCAVLTNKHEQAARMLAEKFFPGLFDAVHGGRAGVQLKPSPEGLVLLCKELGFTPENCAMAGDSANDILTAKAAGAHAAGVSWGFREKDELSASGADFIADSAKELTSHLLSI